MYGLGALRRLREQRQKASQELDGDSVRIEVPADARYEDPDELLHVWTGERWVPWEKWFATAPVEIGQIEPDATAAIPADSACVVGDCGAVRIWLVKDGERWLMHVGTRKPKGRRRDFASPFLEHAIATAERWYGTAGSGWRAEKNSNGTRAEAQDLRSQDSVDEKGLGKRGEDELALDGV